MVTFSLSTANNTIYATVCKESAILSESLAGIGLTFSIIGARVPGSASAASVVSATADFVDLTLNVSNFSCFAP